MIAPFVRQIGGLEADVESLQKHIEDTRLALREVEREAREAVRRADIAANDVIRSARTENLKLIGIIVGAFVSLGAMILGGVETGLFK